MPISSISFGSMRNTGVLSDTFAYPVLPSGDLASCRRTAPVIARLQTDTVFEPVANAAVTSLSGVSMKPLALRLAMSDRLSETASGSAPVRNGLVIIHGDASG